MRRRASPDEKILHPRASSSVAAAPATGQLTCVLSTATLLRLDWSTGDCLDRRPPGHRRDARCRNNRRRLDWRSTMPPPTCVLGQARRASGLPCRQSAANQAAVHQVHRNVFARPSISLRGTVGPSTRLGVPGRSSRRRLPGSWASASSSRRAAARRRHRHFAG